MGGYLSTPATPATKLVYQEDQQLVSHTTRIISGRKYAELSLEERELFKGHHEVSEKDFVLETESTIFHPQGGGQPCDTGSMVGTSIFHVSQVRKTRVGLVLHLGTLEGDSDKMVRGEVKQEIDVKRRELNSRYHTAGHIISCAVKSIAGAAVAKANLEPGKASVSFDEELGDAKADIQARVNELVNSDLRIGVSWIGEREAKERGWEMFLDDRKKVRVVDVGCDGQVCGGTHMCTTSKVGRVVIQKVGRKGLFSFVRFEVMNDGEAVIGKKTSQKERASEGVVEEKVALRRARKLEKQARKLEKVENKQS